MKKLMLTTVLALGLLGVFVFSVSLEAATDRKVSIEDSCDPTTFNAFGQAFFNQPVTCGNGINGPGAVTVGAFLDAIITSGGHNAWKFNPSFIRVDPIDLPTDPGDTITATNQGGGRHTFTEVASFGGGNNPQINALMGLSPATPIGPINSLEPGESITIGPLQERIDPYKYQCMIHPWMRIEVNASGVAFLNPNQ